MADGHVESAGITVLVDNTARTPDLLAEHGFSVLVETAGHRLIFDAGQGDALEHNAKQLGVSLADNNAVVISHGHYDHTGALASLMTQAPRARVLLHPQAVQAHFSRREDGMHYIGMAEEARQAVRSAGERVTWTAGPTEIATGVWVTGAIPRRNDFEDVGGPFFLDEAGTVPDPIEDDQALWMEGTAGLVIVLGCAHSGVINTLDYIAELTGRARIHAVIGGMHLGRASVERLAATAARLAHYGVSFLAPGHCTGEAAAAYLRSHFGGTFAPCSAGEVFVF
ncbi:MAG: MBL fold metallo-hydrolase [Kiritimatiellae bacterium]|nr:MBL fold metallo-hydrolase [Kiritimatiellia bacterium]